MEQGSRRLGSPGELANLEGGVGCWGGCEQQQQDRKGQRNIPRRTPQPHLEAAALGCVGCGLSFAFFPCAVASLWMCAHGPLHAGNWIRRVFVALVPSKLWSLDSSQCFIGFESIGEPCSLRCLLSEFILSLHSGQFLFSGCNVPGVPLQR